MKLKEVNLSNEGEIHRSCLYMVSVLISIILIISCLNIVTGILIVISVVLAEVIISGSGVAVVLAEVIIRPWLILKGLMPIQNI